MGFFDSFKEGYNRGKEEARQEREQQKKDPEGWKKAHPESIKPSKPKKLYQPGHKNKVGTVKNMALINMFGTSDLDEVIEQCAPEFTKAMYGVRDKVYEQDDYKAKYYELKGRTDELEKIYADLKRQNYELLKQNQELMQIVKNLGK